MNKSIFDLLKEGRTVESLTEEFYDALYEAQDRYEKWQEAEKKRIAEQEYKKQRVNEARSNLGSALIQYLSALDYPIGSKTYNTVDLLIDALPRLQILRERGWML